MSRTLRDLINLATAAAAALERVLAVTSPGPPQVEIASDEDATVDADIRYLAETFERVNEKHIDEIRSFDALNGVVLAAIFGIFLYFLDKDQWLLLISLVAPASITIWNFRGRVAFSPDPALFEPLFAEDPSDAMKVLIENHKRDITKNARLRNRKRQGFTLALAALFAVAIAAAGSKEVQSMSAHEAQRSHRVACQSDSQCQASKQDNQGGGPGSRPRVGSAQRP